MKSLPKIGKAAGASRGSQFLQRTALGGVLLASLFASSGAYGQGEYYPVTNPGITNFGSFNNRGITVNSNPNLQLLQTSLDTLYPPNPPTFGGYTMSVPAPAGKTPVDTAHYLNAVEAAIQGILSGGTLPPNVDLPGMVAESVAWRQSDAAAVAGRIAKTIIANNPSTAEMNLEVNVVKTLADSQPTLIATMMPSILYAMTGAGQVATGPVDPATNNWGANATSAGGVAALVKAAITESHTTNTLVAGDTGSIATIVSAGMTAITSGTTSASKSSLLIDPLTGYVQILLTAPVANNSVPVISKILAAVTNTNALAAVNPTNQSAALSSILDAAHTALGSVGATLDPQTMGALTEGALTTQGALRSAIKTQLDTYTATSTYTDAVIAGYSSIIGLTGAPALAAYQGAFTANQGYGDAVASGAALVGSVTSSDLVHYALVDDATTSTAPGHGRAILTAIISANPGNAASVALGAINTTTKTVYGGAPSIFGFGDIAWAVGDAAPIGVIGSTITTIITNSALTSTTYSIATVQDIVNQAILGAGVGGNSDADADIVYKAEGAAKTTPATIDPLVRQAIDSMGKTRSFIAVVAALAGDNGSNVTAIERAAYNTNPSFPQGEMQNQTTDPIDITAAMNGANVVTGIRANPYLAFITTLNDYVASPSTQSTEAELYAAILTNSNEADAGLALAIKQTNVPDTTLLEDAQSAIRVFSSTQAANLNMVDAVAEKLKMEAAGSGGVINDMVDYIGHQIVTSPALVKDIAIAATVVDPDNAHFIAHAVAFNSPGTVSTTVASIFSYAQITNPNPYGVPTALYPATGYSGAFAPGKTFPGSVKGAIIDQPAAAAAITAGFVTGLIESSTSATLQSNLVATMTQIMAAAQSENQVALQGPAAVAGAGKVFNAPGDLSKGFQQYTATGITTARTVGAAGAITGYMAEVTYATQTTITPVTIAVLSAATQAAKTYVLQIAQAAGQAFAWVANPTRNPSIETLGGAGTPIYDIANAILAGDSGGPGITQIENAVQYGVQQADLGVIGAGALGLNATGLNYGTVTVAATNNANSDFYIHRSAQGTPVTDIFNL